MATKPPVGHSGGQRYDLERAIQTFLQQMVEGCQNVVPTVIKELLQNADDAGATEVEVILDERVPPPGLPQEYRVLYRPALLVRNNAPFRLREEVASGDKDDFAALCDVASGHKRSQAVAAGRFGIGFNSVYFLTDTPVLFSRREVHVFDILHHIFESEDNGWRFSLDDFPATATSGVGSIKFALEWMLPKIALGGTQTFGNIAMTRDGDYRNALLRLPLRQHVPTAKKLHDDTFDSPEVRRSSLEELVSQAARSVLFLKNVETVTFEILKDANSIVEVASIKITPNPPDFTAFLESVKRSTDENLNEKLYQEFDRTVLWSKIGAVSTQWDFQLRHTARYDDPDLRELRLRLLKNEERAVPWAALAIPKNGDSMRLDGTDIPAWRVFLPLNEPGPCGCLLSAALFVGPSRQKSEYRTDGSDEALRKTRWNEALVEKALVPLLCDASLDVLDLAPGFVANQPKDYIALFPTGWKEKGCPTSLTEYFRSAFSRQPWVLRVPDLWDQPVDLPLGGDGGKKKDSLHLERVPEWLSVYRARFQHLSDEKRRFVRLAIGDAVRARLGESEEIIVEQDHPDVARAVLSSDEPPAPKDLQRLLDRLAKNDEPLSKASLKGLWCFKTVGEPGDLARYEPDIAYLYKGSDQVSPGMDALWQLRLVFDDTVHVSPDAGLPKMEEVLRREVDNLLPADDSSVLDLLRRVNARHGHDSFTNPHEMVPLVNFLCSLEPWKLTTDLRLPFIVRTAHQQHERLATGIIALKPADPSTEDEDAWNAFYKAVFPEMEPLFAEQAQRLVSHAPVMLKTLSVPGREVVAARSEDALALLLRAQRSDPGTSERLQKHKRGKGKLEAKNRSAEDRAVSVLFAQAERRWDRLNHEEQTAFLSLPVHRRSDGTYGPLLRAGEDAGNIAAHYRLQSEDDVRDAPIQLAETELLQVVEPTIKRFYRVRLNIEEHNRTAILKQVLKEVGTRGEASTNHKLLMYLAKYLREQIETLEESANDYDHQDAEELRLLLVQARTAPCVDGKWRTAEGCCDAYELAERLRKQGWAGGRPLEDLLARLFPDRHILTIDQDSRQAVRNLLQDFPRLDPKTLGNAALCSDSQDLEVKARLKILMDNWDDRPDRAQVSSAIEKTVVPCADGERPLAGSESVSPELENQVPLLVRLLAPHRILRDRFSQRYNVPAELLNQVLRLLLVPEVDGDEIDQRLQRGFDSLWPSLGTKDRFQVLQHVNERRLVNVLRKQVQDLDVVHVASKPSWVQPIDVVSPRLLSTDPPLLEPGQRPEAPEQVREVEAVWDAWCGIQDVGALGKRLCDIASSLPPARREDAGKRLVAWVDKVTGDPSSAHGEIRDAFARLPWMLARRGAEVLFKPPKEVLVHEGEALLKREFWVSYMGLHGKMAENPARWGFVTALKAGEETLRSLVRCLENSVGVDRETTGAVYRVVSSCLEQKPTLTDLWESLAADVPVFKLFRDPDRAVTSRQIFLGNQKHTKDIGESLFCLAAQHGIPRTMEKVLSGLGISDAPSSEQLLYGLATLASETRRTRQTHGQLFRALKGLAEDEQFTEKALGDCCVRTCAGTYRPLKECLWDEELGRPGCFSKQSEDAVGDASDEISWEFCNWAQNRHAGVVRYLRALADPEIQGSIVEVRWSPAISQVLGPWRDWLIDLSHAESRLRDEVIKKGFSPPDEVITLVPVERIPVRFLFGERAYALTEESRGPLAVYDRNNRILVRRQGAEDSYASSAELGAFDRAIVAQLATLLVKNRRATMEDSEKIEYLIKGTLERPSVTIERIRRTQSQHFLHQYQDQVADADYAAYFVEYLRTKENTSRYKELDGMMWDILRERYVNNRRDIIRGHGYDELSVFAELVQNAEDAYLQRHVLGMERPASRAARFSYLLQDDKTTVLQFEHHGRPFNYFRHGAREDVGYSRDVEGVLRSAGSFKAKAEHLAADQKPVGRFGLGFKSVYLLTDSPSIHSESWHFRIEAGCLPWEVPPPGDLPAGATRILIPLRPDAQEMTDPKGQRLAGLLPFLREIHRLELVNSDQTEPVSLNAEAAKLTSGESALVELVEVSGAKYLHQGQLRFLRVRGKDSQAQLGVYLGEQGLPSPWDEAFDSDLFAVLPLKTRLGCGVGVSNLFEIQSGRTHLVDPKGNAPHFAEVAGLVRELPKAIAVLANKSEKPRDFLMNFWGLWRWDSGDEEARALREALASAVALLPLEHPVVPGVIDGEPVKFGEKPVVYFSRVPDDIQKILIEENAPILPDGKGKTIPLREGHVAPELFAIQYLKACKYGKVSPERSLTRLDWHAVGEGFQQADVLVKQPNLLNQIAETLQDEHQALQVCSWLGETRVASETEGPALPRELLRHDFGGRNHLPVRLLHTLHPVYSEKAVTLLLRVGLRSVPSGKELRNLIEGGALSRDESIGLLRFLAEQDRYTTKGYFVLSQLLQSGWIPDGKNRVTAADAVERFMKREQADWSLVFKVWLGIVQPTPEVPAPPPPPPPPDPAKVLKAVSRWWKQAGVYHIQEYEMNTYPLGKPPEIQGDFDSQNRSSRKQWLSLLMLGALHTLGRTRPQQNRDFLRLCERKGWMDVFADPEYRADRWMGVLEQYLDEKVDQSQYYYWMQQFIRIFQLARWLPEYVETFLAIDRVQSRFALSEFTVSRASRQFQGGGVDAPPVDRTLGQGACFVLRELVRLGVLKSPFVHRYCYVPSRGVRNLLDALDAPGLFFEYGEAAERAPAIHEFLIKHLGEKEATFGGSFDLPLRVIAADRDLQKRFLGETQLEIDDEETE